MVLETSEGAIEEILQTHYYRASYETLKKAYLELIEGMGHNILSVNDDYKELYSEKGKIQVVAKIIQQTPIETSIDFYINSDSIFGKIAATKFLGAIYDALKQKFEFKGVSLHR